jgi:hypothetical protein
LKRTLIPKKTTRYRKMMIPLPLELFRNNSSLEKKKEVEGTISKALECSGTL